jgi:hypothetical protein
VPLATGAQLLAQRISAEIKAMRSNGETVPTSGTTGHVLTKAAVGSAWAAPSGDPWTEQVLTADFANSTTAGTQPAGLSIATLAAGLYEYKAILLVSSVAIATGVQIAMRYPASVTGRFQISVPLTTGTSLILHQNADNQWAAATAFPVNGAVYAAIIEGTFRNTGSLASAIFPSIRSEIAASAVTLKADSCARYARIAA